MLGTKLEDPFYKEGSKTKSEYKIKGIGLLPLKTTFFENKLTRQIKSESYGHVNQKLMVLKL